MPRSLRRATSNDTGAIARQCHFATLRNADSAGWRRPFPVTRSGMTETRLNPAQDTRYVDGPVFELVGQEGYGS